MLSGFYPYTWWVQLAPVKNRGGSVDKVVDQNSPPYFSICTINKTFSLERKEAQNGGENLSQRLRES